MLPGRPNVSPDFFHRMLKSGSGEIIISLPNGVADNMLNVQRVTLFQGGDQNTFVRLERDAKYRLTYFYTTSGLGTSVASVPLAPFASVKNVTAKLQWSPEAIYIEVEGGGAKRHADGKKTNKVVIPNGEDGVLEFGDDGAELGMFTMHAGDQLVAKASAIKAWEHMLEGCKVLLSGQSDQGFMFEVIQKNFLIVMLVTGFEAYCKDRFLEMEKEGWAADKDALTKVFFSKRERDGGGPDALNDDAKKDGISFAEKLVKTGRIDFQNWDYCKKAYNKGYGIKFSELGLANDQIEHMQRFIKHRHRIVHVSAVDPILEYNNGEPLFCTKAGLCEGIIEMFSNFIKLLHAKTISRS